MKVLLIMLVLAAAGAAAWYFFTEKRPEEPSQRVSNVNAEPIVELATPAPAPQATALAVVPSRPAVEAPKPRLTPPLERRARFSRKGLRITSSPPGAEVLVNFSKKGTTPIVVRLPNDINKIIVRLAGYRRYETILLKGLPDRELSVTLQREDGEEFEPRFERLPEPVEESPDPVPMVP
jgi:hypothetical protein